MQKYLCPEVESRQSELAIRITRGHFLITELSEMLDEMHEVHEFRILGQKILFLRYPEIGLMPYQVPIRP